MGEEVMSESQEVRSFINWNFFQLKCITYVIHLGTWTQVSQVMSLYFFNHKDGLLLYIMGG